jgi:hypothetical protein
LKLADCNLHFILGIGRSGTSLLSSILGANPSVLSTPENDFFVLRISDLGELNRWSYAHKRSFFNSLWYIKLNDFSFWRIDKQKLEKDLMSLPEVITYNDICEKVYLSYIGANLKDNIHTIIDKNPHNGRYVEKIMTVSPNSKFVVIVRDYVETLKSRKKNAFEPINTWAFLAFSWRRYYQQILKLKRSYPDKIYIIKYEQLIENQKEEIEKICCFLNISYMPEMLNYDEFNKKLVDLIDFNDEEKKIFYQVHSGLLRKIAPPTSENVQRVPTYVHAICSPVASKYGYSENIENMGFKLLFLFPVSIINLVWHFFLCSYYYIPFKIRRLLFFVRGNKKI